MWFVPTKFLCRLPLRVGTIVTGVIMLIILVIFAIATLIQVMYINDCSTSSCKPYAWRNCYAYSVTGCISIIFLIIANLWFFWGISKEKPSVVLCWLVLSSMWLAQVFCLLINLIYLHYYYSEDTAAGLLAFIFGLILIAILIYGLCVIAGYWLELKRSKKIGQVRVGLTDKGFRTIDLELTI